MTDFSDALQSKIDELIAERSHIDGKIELLEELLEGEGTQTTKAAPKGKPGRPKGSKGKKKASKSKGSSNHAPNDDLYEEAMTQLNKSEGGTSEEFQKSRIAKFNPVARPTESLGAGITAGTKEQVLEGPSGKRKSNAHVPIGDNE